MDYIICASCANLTREDSKFCNTCGANIHRQCKLCGADNAILASFCESCGADLNGQAGITRGLAFQRARLWREAFQALDWWDYTRLQTWMNRGARAKINEAIENRMIPSVDDPNEPWVLFVEFKSKTRFQPESQSAMFKRTDANKFVPVHSAINLKAWLSTDYLIATRCRIGIVCSAGGKSGALMIPFSDLTQSRWENNGEVEIGSKQGVLRFKIEIGGPGWLNVATVFYPDNNLALEKVMALNNVRMRADERDSFMGLIGGFITEIHDTR